ncbi:MAG: Ig-like domain-containing protein, partial [Gemmatimonadota bacterium]|nr:Ig-like domain-containing protein [Gemmatimonadota bacterium]
MKPRRWTILCLLAISAVLACDNKTDGVTPPPVNASGNVRTITLTPSASFLQAGQQRTLTADALDSAGTLVAGAVLKWTTDAPSVAAVSAAGVVTAQTPGVAHLTASVGNVSATATVTVTALAAGVSAWQLTRPGFTDGTLLGVWDNGAGISWAVGTDGLILRSLTSGAWERIPSGVTT